jgi:hypothetical protein
MTFQPKGFSGNVTFPPNDMQSMTSEFGKPLKHFFTNQFTPKLIVLYEFVIDVN